MKTVDFSNYITKQALSQQNHQEFSGNFPSPQHVKEITSCHLNFNIILTAFKNEQMYGNLTK